MVVFLDDFSFSNQNDHNLEEVQNGMTGA